MNKNLRLFLPALAMSLGLSVWCAAQEAKPDMQQFAFFANLSKGVQKQTKLSELAAAREKSVAALRADLATEWTSVIIAQRYDCSCADTVYSGFHISRAGESLTVAPWFEIEGVGGKGDSRPMTQPEMERLLSETVLFYLTASLLVTPAEEAGPFPSEPAKEAEWRQRYLAAGGSPLGSDAYGIDVRVATPDGMKRHSDMWGLYCPSDFKSWITAYGILPRG